MTSKSKTTKSRIARPAIKPNVVHKPKPIHVHTWVTFYNHMTEAPEGHRCACGAQEWF